MPAALSRNLLIYFYDDVYHFYRSKPTKFYSVEVAEHVYFTALLKHEIDSDQKAQCFSDRNLVQGMKRVKIYLYTYIETF
jgi:hypothetical protein